jgi:hypothetical protein
MDTDLIIRDNNGTDSKGDEVRHEPPVFRLMTSVFMAMKSAINRPPADDFYPS